MKSRRPVIALVVVVLIAGGLTYQFRVANRRAPSFSQGGHFADANDFSPVGTNGRPVPYGDATATTTPVPTTSGAVAAARSTTSTTSAAPLLDAGVVAKSGTIVVPTNGLYRYSVSGSEGASGFGNRNFPDNMNLVVHTDPAHADRKVLDLRFSGNHEEREILSFGNDGVAFTYEAGSITFGPGTQTSEGSYSPPMVQVPWPLAIGTKVSKTSPVTDSSGGHPRTEKWTTQIIGRETISVLGKPRETWVVEIQRTTTESGNEHVDRYRKYWYDPALGIWVKWSERFNASRDMLVTFKYNANYTAQLQSFTPA